MTSTLEGPAYRCPVCLARGDWYLLRHGDAVVSWACDSDLTAVLRAMQRDFERTEVVVKETVKEKQATTDPPAAPHTREYHQALLQVWHSGAGFMRHRYRRCGFSGAGNCCCGRPDRSPIHAD